MTASRRGVKRLAPFRPANFVETCGRISLRPRTSTLTSRSVPAGHAEVLLQTLRPVLAPSHRVDLANVPLHNNCGDSAIWLGQLKVLRALGVDTSRARRFTNILDQFAVPRPSPIVLVRGGGYFGDLWPDELRAFFDACEQYQGQSLIFMPQSMGTLSHATVLAVTASIERHGDVRLLLRDTRSAEKARELFPTALVSLAPDSAQALTAEDLMGLVPRPNRDLPPIRVIARSDSEGDGSLVGRAQELNLKVLDFVDAESSKTNKILRWTHEFIRARFPHRLASAILIRALPKRSVYDHHARAELRRAVSLIAGAEKVVTDRLHASIIASILEIEVVAVDTGYGKLRSYFEAWPSKFVTFADDADSALRDIDD
nr:polysaccharide pyruvyl transferase family protein [Aeromicrobium sp. CFBP 8757]